MLLVHIPAFAACLVLQPSRNCHRLLSGKQRLIFILLRAGEPLENLIKYLLSVLLSVMLMNPVLARKGNARWVFGDLFPISLVPSIPCCFPSLLHSSHAVVSAHHCQQSSPFFVSKNRFKYAPDLLISPDSSLHPLLSCPSQTNSNSNPIFHRLRRPLRTRRQERMRRVSDQQNPRMFAHPRRQRITVDQLPIHQRGCFFYNGFANGIPPFEDFVHVLEFAGKGPRFISAVLVPVGEYPAAVGTVLDGAEEEVHVRTDPAVEGVAVGAEFGGSGIGDHVGVWEPAAFSQCMMTQRLRKGDIPSSPNSIPAALGLIFKPKDQLACFRADAISTDDNVGCCLPGTSSVLILLKSPDTTPALRKRTARIHRLTLSPSPNTIPALSPSSKYPSTLLPKLISIPNSSRAYSNTTWCSSPLCPLNTGASGFCSGVGW